MPFFTPVAKTKGQAATRNEGTGHPLKGVVPCPLAFRVPLSPFVVPSLSLRCPFDHLVGKKRPTTPNSDY